MKVHVIIPCILLYCLSCVFTVLAQEQEGLHMVGIGGQHWSKYNLAITHFLNGDSIPYAASEDAWLAAGEEHRAAWCYYENDKSNSKSYGILYNYYAVTDARGLIPIGWHLPTVEEFEKLITFLGGEKLAGLDMKTAKLWEHSGGLDRNGNDLCGLSITPSGMRSIDGKFSGLGKACYLWTASIIADHERIFVYHIKHTSAVLREEESSKAGYAIRCIKD